MSGSKEMKEFICISCPVGCRLTCEKTAEGVKVTGNACPRGVTYGRDEMTAPKRMVTTTVAVIGGSITRLPVKTAAPVPKDKIFEVLDALKYTTVTAPVEIGAAVLRDAAGTGVDVVATAPAAK